MMKIAGYTPAHATLHASLVLGLTNEQSFRQDEQHVETLVVAVNSLTVRSRAQQKASKGNPTFASAIVRISIRGSVLNQCNPAHYYGQYVPILYCIGSSFVYKV